MTKPRISAPLKFTDTGPLFLHGLDYLKDPTYAYGGF